jgi:predicted metalloprotease with PDZ domain
MRYLYLEFAKKNKNYSPEDLQKACELVAGKSLNDFFERYVRGTAEIDYNAILSGIGLRFSTGETENKTAYLGANLRQDGDKLIVASLPKETPAYEQGLNANDQIVAVDGNRASQTFLASYLSEKKPSDRIKLTVFRFDALREIEVTLGGRAKQDFQITAIENSSEDQKRLYREFLSAELK